MLSRITWHARIIIPFINWWHAGLTLTSVDGPDADTTNCCSSLDALSTVGREILGMRTAEAKTLSCHRPQQPPEDAAVAATVSHRMTNEFIHVDIGFGAITGPRWPPPSPPPPPTPTLYSSLKSDCQKTSRVNGHLQTDTPSHAEAKRPRWIMNGHWHARQRHSSENLPSPPPPPLPPPLPPLLLLIKPNSYHPATISTITITTDKTTQQSLPNHRHHLNAAIINTNAATAVNASTITTTTTTTTSTLLLPLLQPPPLLPQPLPLPCLLPPP